MLRENNACFIVPHPKWWFKSGKISNGIQWMELLLISSITTSILTWSNGSIHLSVQFNSKVFKGSSVQFYFIWTS